MCSFNTFILFSALFLVVLVSCMFVPMLVASRKKRGSRAKKMKSWKNKSCSEQLLSEFKTSIFLDHILS